MPRSDGLASVLQSYLNLNTTNKSSSVTGSEDQESALPSISVVVAVVEGKRSLENMIGIACIDLNTLEIRLTRFRDPFNYAETKEYIKSLGPDIVIYPGYERKNLIESNPQFTSGSRNILVEPYDVNYFDEMKGLNYLMTYGRNFNPRDLGFSRVLPVVAVSACFNYILHTLNIKEFQANCMDVHMDHREGYLNMDLTTIKTLEIFASADNGDFRRSLFGLYSRTFTKRGMRIIRANLFQPPAQKEIIVNRHDAVDELIRKRPVMDDLASELSALDNINFDLALKTMVVRDRAPSANKANKYIESLVDAAVFLREVLARVEGLMKVLQDLNSSLFQSLHSEMSKDEAVYRHLSSLIRHVISNSCTVTKGMINFKTTKLMAINPEVDPFLEIKLKTYSEFMENMYALADTYARSYGRTVRLNYLSTRGWHFILPVAENEREEGITLPNVFICVQRKGKSIFATTKSLIDIETNLRRVEKDIYKMAGEAVIKLIDDLSLHIGPISALFEHIGTLDFLHTLAFVAIENNFVRPQIGKRLEGKNVINPLLLLKEQGKELKSQVVANPIPRLSSDGMSMVLLSGANQSGKSCYLSTVALLQIMAQMGSFVPVESEDSAVTSEDGHVDQRVKTTGSLTVPLVDQIFTRMGMDDDYTSSSSSFLSEVTQISYILKRATKKSLVIIDELGRGTSVEEGVSFCFAVAEKLLKIKCITFIASHFHDLIKLECLYPNIVCYEMEHKRQQEGDNVNLIFTHKAVVMGDEHFTEYGIDTADSLGLPKDIIMDARNIVSQIQTLSPEITVEAQRRREMYKLYLAIMKIAETDWSANRVAISEFFEGAKRQFLERMRRLSPGEYN